MLGRPFPRLILRDVCAGAFIKMLAQTMLRIGREHLGFAELAQTMPCAIIALATFMKPATLAPLT